MPTAREKVLKIWSFKFFSKTNSDSETGVRIKSNSDCLFNVRLMVFSSVSSFSFSSAHSLALVNDS